MVKVRLALIHNNHLSPWIKIDREILSTAYDVHEVYVPGMASSIKVLKTIYDCDMLLFWFGSFNFLLPALIGRFLGKKIMIIAGGYDTSKLPELRYGAYCENLFSIFLRRFLFSLSNKVIGVSQSNALEISDNLILRHRPEWVYLGFKKNETISLKSFDQRENQVVMISNISSPLTFRLKGMDIFIETARKMPNIKFIHIGAFDASFAPDLPRNLSFKGIIPNNSPEFYEILNSSKVIFQHSMLESFCAAVVDGALMGCLPIVSDRFSLPEIVGEGGIVVQYNDQVELEKQIRRACSSQVKSVESITDYFQVKFSFEKRRDQLLKVVSCL